MRAQASSTCAGSSSRPARSRIATRSTLVSAGIPSIGSPFTTVPPRAVSPPKWHPAAASGTPVPVSSGATRMVVIGRTGPDTLGSAQTASARISLSVPDAASTTPDSPSP